jgi:hypothetical protein
VFLSIDIIFKTVFVVLPLISIIPHFNPYPILFLSRCEPIILRKWVIPRQNQCFLILPSNNICQIYPNHKTKKETDEKHV